MVLYNVYTLGYPDGFIQCIYFQKQVLKMDSREAATPEPRKKLLGNSHLGKRHLGNSHLGNSHLVKQASGKQTSGIIYIYIYIYIYILFFKAFCEAPGGPLRGNPFSEPVFGKMNVSVCIYIYIYISFLRGSGVAASREFIFRTCFWKKMNEQKKRTQTQWGGRRRRPSHWGRRRRRCLCVLCFCSFIFLYYEYLWIFLIYSLYIPYIYVLNIFHIFSFVCFVIYSVNRFKSNFFQSCHISSPDGSA